MTSFPASFPVDHERRGLIEERAEDGRGLGGEVGLFERRLHQRHPPVTGGLIDGKWRMTLAQTRVPALLDVARWSAESADQEVFESLLSTGQIVSRIHRPQQVVVGNLRVEGAHQSREAFFANHCVELKFTDLHAHVRMRELSRKTVGRLFRRKSLPTVSSFWGGDQVVAAGAGDGRFDQRAGDQCFRVAFVEIHDGVDVGRLAFKPSLEDQV